MMDQVPRSALDLAGGMNYFPRMLDKIRKHAAGRLKTDYHGNLGNGADSWCTGFLRIDYDALKARVLAGGTDEEILQWCYENGRELNALDLRIWNSFIAKLGWNDAATKRLEEVKQENGLGDREDIITMPQFFDVDEGRAK